LGNGQASEDGKLLDTLRTISEHLRGGTTEDIGALASSDLKSLESSIDTLSQLQATAGSVTDQLQTATSRIESLQSSITASLANTDGADIAQTSIAYSNEQAAYEAALRAGASIVQESLLQFLQ
jgi:flagellar hook-associated protein 3 FlgL